MKKYKYYIGIDTGTNTGIAVWNRDDRRLTMVCSMVLWKAIDQVRSIDMNNPGEVFVRVEDARLRTWIPREKNEKAERGKREGAGSVKRDAVIWEEFLTDQKIDHEFVAPKRNKTKLEADYFRKLTGWTLTTNNHGRDAAMLVFGL